jgi:hypothetical protein
MFALADEGYRTVFEQLVACILSIRTRDEVSLAAARATETVSIHGGRLPCDEVVLWSFRGVGRCAPTWRWV